MVEQVDREMGEMGLRQDGDVLVPRTADSEPDRVGPRENRFGDTISKYVARPLQEAWSQAMDAGVVDVDPNDPALMTALKRSNDYIMDMAGAGLSVGEAAAKAVAASVGEVFGDVGGQGRSGEERLTEDLMAMPEAFAGGGLSRGANLLDDVLDTGGDAIRYIGRAAQDRANQPGSVPAMGSNLGNAGISQSRANDSNPADILEDFSRKREAMLSAPNDASLEELARMASEAAASRGQAVSALSSTLGDRGGLRLTQPETGRRVAISPGLSGEEVGKFRLTFVNEEGSPTNHTVFSTREEALEEALQSGYVQADGPRSSSRVKANTKTVFHGTDSEFEDFDPEQSNTAKHIYTSTISDDAAAYGRNLLEFETDADIFDLRPENRGKAESAALRKVFEDGGLSDYFEDFDDFEAAFDSGDMYQRFSSQTVQNAVIDELFEATGSTALHIPDAGFGGSMSESVVFRDPKSLRRVVKKTEEIPTQVDNSSASSDDFFFDLPEESDGNFARGGLALKESRKGIRTQAGLDMAKNKTQLDRKKADLDGDGELSDYEEQRGEAIQKAEMDDEMAPDMACGGIMGDPMMTGIDPVSGNEIPVGATAENVRDDIPVNISQDEYVLPAHVVKYHGLKYIMDLQAEAEMGLMTMKMDGLIQTVGDDYEDTEEESDGEGSEAAEVSAPDTEAEEGESGPDTTETPEGNEIDLAGVDVSEEEFEDDETEEYAESAYPTKTKSPMYGMMKKPKVTFIV